MEMLNLTRGVSAGLSLGAGQPLTLVWSEHGLCSHPESRWTDITCLMFVHRSKRCYFWNKPKRKLHYMDYCVTSNVGRF